MDLGIAGRVAVVGGATSGLGIAAATQLANEGCDLLIWARNPDALRRTAHELSTHTRRRIEWVAADASQPDSANLVADGALEAFGKVDILVLNSGGPPATDPLSTEPALFAAAFQLLALTPIALGTRLLPQMAEHGWGRIIAALSWSVREPIHNLVLSNTGRSALAAWIKTISRAAPAGVTANGVLPGRFATQRMVELDERRAEDQARPLEHVRRDALASVPAGRDGDPKEFGALVAFLASEQASYINGAFVPIDGGMLQSLG